MTTNASGLVNTPGALGRVTFLDGQGELPMLEISTQWSTAEIYLLGAHVTQFKKQDEAPLLFVSQSWNGPVMMELSRERPEAKELYRVPKDGSVNDDLVNCLMSPPILRGGYIYGIAAFGDLRCLEARTGRRVWQSAAPAGHGRCRNAFMVSNGDRVFFANDQGELIIARISPAGYEEISRAKLIRPVSKIEGRMLVWSHPAFANRCVYARNDEEIVCVSLAGPETQPAR